MTHARHTPGVRGFSLVEILIAILVLAFGLLGLAAIFPVVVTQQRDASDRMLGPAAAEGIEAQLFGAADIINWDFVNNKLVDSFDQLPAGYDAGDWFFEDAPVKLLDDGEVRINSIDEDGKKIRQDVPAAARLFPPMFGGGQPQFVWDVAVRKPTKDAQLQVALFVRRVDTAIRVPEGKTLTNVLTGWGMASGEPTALPVAQSTDAAKRPSSNGLGDYSGIRQLRNIQPLRASGSSSRPYDRFRVSNLTSIERSVLARKGQKIVDSLGIVRTIVELDEDGNAMVEPAWSTDDRVQILYVPQEPVAVRVIRVEAGS
ncbi:MAG: prepilin-type N-terminal cleavage/methylation domain-containing protein [Phycisphaerales bacterium]